jgi:hypothetical protein
MKSGGGIRSNKVTRQGVRTGSQPKAIRPGGVGQIGASQGSHATTKGDTGYRGAKFFGGSAPSAKFGNEVAAATVCGPGGSRTVYSSGSQGGLKPARPMPAGRDILNEFGPNKR